MKNILLVQYFFKPFTSNQSFRYEQMINKLDNKNINVDVLTSNHYGLDQEELYKHGKIYRVNSKILMKTNVINKNTKNTPTQKAKMGRLKTIIYKLIWPDFSMFWIPYAIIKAKKILKNNTYETVISGSFPFSSHIVGYYIKKTNPDVNWIVDYIDPFAIIDDKSNPSNNVRLYKRFNIFAEKKINGLADKIIIQREAYDSYKKFFSNDISKVIIAPPMLGIDRDLVEKIKLKLLDKERTNIVFVGSLYKSIRNPEPILKVFRELSKIDSNFHLHFIGDTKDCLDILKDYKNKKEFPLSIYGKVSREDAISYMKSADVLLNISNKSDVQLPGKVVEYIYMRKKIINFSPTKDNNSIQFFKHIGAHKSVLNIVGEINIEELRNFITGEVEIENMQYEHFFPENIGKLYF